MREFGGFGAGNTLRLRHSTELLASISLLCAGVAHAKVYDATSKALSQSISAAGGENRDLFQWVAPNGSNSATIEVVAQRAEPITLIAYDMRLQEIGRASAADGKVSLPVIFSGYYTYLRVVPTGGTYDTPEGTKFQRSVSSTTGNQNLLPPYQIRMIPAGSSPVAPQRNNAPTIPSLYGAEARAAPPQEVRVASAPVPPPIAAPNPVIGAKSSRTSKPGASQKRAPQAVSTQRRPWGMLADLADTVWDDGQGNLMAFKWIKPYETMEDEDATPAGKVKDTFQLNGSDIVNSKGDRISLDERSLSFSPSGAHYGCNLDPAVTVLTCEVQQGGVTKSSIYNRIPPQAYEARYKQALMNVAAREFGPFAEFAFAIQNDKLSGKYSYFLANQLKGKRNSGPYPVRIFWAQDNKGNKFIQEEWLIDKYTAVGSWEKMEGPAGRIKRMSDSTSDKVFSVQADGSVSGIGRLHNEDGVTVRLMVYNRYGDGLALRLYKGKDPQPDALMEEYILTPSTEAVFAAGQRAQQNAIAAYWAERKSSSSGLLGMLGQLAGAAAGMALTDGSTAGAMAGASIFAKSDEERSALLQGANTALAEQQAAAERQRQSDAEFQAGLRAAVARGEAQRQANLARSQPAPSSVTPAPQPVPAKGAAASQPTPPRPQPRNTAPIATPAAPPALQRPAKTAPPSTPIPKPDPTIRVGMTVTDELAEDTWRLVSEVAGVSVYATYHHELRDQVISRLRISNANAYPVYVAITPHYVCKDGSSSNGTPSASGIAAGGTASGGFYDYPCKSSVPGAIGFASLAVTPK